jgi:anti-anti-sigma factor
VRRHPDNDPEKIGKIPQYDRENQSMVAPPAPGCYIHVEESSEGTRVHFPGSNISLDETNVILTGEKLGRIVEKGCRCLFLEFRNVSFLASSALGMLLRLHTQLKSAGGRLVLCNVVGHIHEIFVVTRLDQILTIQ